MDAGILQPLEDRHIPILHQMLTAGESGRMWRTRGVRVSLDEFVHIVREQSGHPLVAVDPATGGPVALCALYAQDPVSSIAYLSVGGDMSHPRSLPIIGAAIEHYLDYLFTVVGLRKVCIELPASHVERLRAGLRRWDGLVVQEGVLRAHVRFGPTVEDLHVFGILVDDWMAVGRPHLARDGAAVHPLTTTRPTLELLAEVIDELGDEPLTAELTGGADLVVDLGLDSLALVEVLSELEDRLDRPIVLHDPMSSVRTVQDLADLIEASGPEAATTTDLTWQMERPA